MVPCEEYFRFEVGDIVEENEILAWYPDSPLTGIVVSIERDSYFYYGSEEVFYQDKLTIFWLKQSHVETLPSDLVTLIHRKK